MKSARIFILKVETLRCENLCGKTSLVELSEELKAAKCLLCNDSGAMHLANFLGTPIFAIFGATSPIKRDLFLRVLQ